MPPRGAPNGPRKHSTNNAVEKVKRDIKRAQKEVVRVAQKEEVDVETASVPPPDTPLSDAQEVWVKAQEQRELYRQAREKADKQFAEYTRRKQELDRTAGLLDDRQTKLDARTHETEATEKTLEEREQRLGDAEKALTTQRADLDRREQGLNQREWQLEQRRIDAEAGFLQEERASLGRLAEQRQNLLADLTGERERLYSDHEESRRKLTADIERQLADFRRAQSAGQADLDRQREGIAVREKELRSLERRLKAKQENQEEDRQYIRQQAESAVADQMKRLELELHRRASEYDVVIEHARGLEQQLRERNEVIRRHGHRSLPELDADIKQLAAENADLHRKLAAVPAEFDVESFERLRREHAECHVIRNRLELEKAKLETERNSYIIAATEMEQLRDHRDILQNNVSLQRKLLDEARGELDKLLNNSHAPSPFPGLQEMDDDPKLMEKRGTSDEPPNLGDLVTYIQLRILGDRKHRRGRVPIAYSKRDIRCLIGGLAMSRLHILQGISGIGKTTLPKAFAEAIGADYEVIEVQAGWRDRHDLIGHFNAFEHRYYETRFTKAVYRAGCAAYLGRPFFIVLDEMNLAHPEQYFADILSGLENRGKPLRLQLTTHPVGPRTNLLVPDQGTQLPVPDNVWFFGTANHDETTVQFADKTYDRAHVIELPVTPPSLEEKSVRAGAPLSRKALHQSFTLAWRQHNATGDIVIAFLKEYLARPLANNFKIGWGPRLEQQIRDFVPVVVAAEGSIGEATDHILATRILHKLRGRYNLRQKSLEELRDLLESRWPKLVAPDTVNAENSPVAATALLDELIEARD